MTNISQSVSNEAEISAVPRLLKLADVIKLTTLSRSSLYRFVLDGKFPAPLALGDKSRAWLESEVVAWIKSRAKIAVL